MPKRNRGKNTKKGNDNSAAENTAPEAEVLSEIIPCDKPRNEEKSGETIKSETAQVDVKKDEKNQASIPSSEVKSEKVQPKLSETLNPDIKKEELAKAMLQTPVEPTASKQETKKPEHNNNKQAKEEQKKPDATPEEKQNVSPKNEQKQNKPGKQSDQQKKSETKKNEHQNPTTKPAEASKGKESNKKPENVKSDAAKVDSTITENIQSEGQEKTKPTEPIKDQPKPTKPVKPNAKQTQSAKPESLPNKPSTGQEQLAKPVKQDSKQPDSVKPEKEESAAKESEPVKVQGKENKPVKQENKKAEPSKQEASKSVSPKPSAKKTGDKADNKKPEIDANYDKSKTGGNQTTPSKQAESSVSNVKEQGPAKELEQGKSKVTHSEASVLAAKKSESGKSDNKQSELEVNPGKAKSSSKPTASKQGAKQSESAAPNVKEQGPVKESVQGKLEVQKSETSKPDAKQAKNCKAEGKQSTPNKANDKKAEPRKADSKPNEHNPTGGKLVETNNPDAKLIESNKLNDKKLETKKQDSKHAQPNKADSVQVKSNKADNKKQLNKPLEPIKPQEKQPKSSVQDSEPKEISNDKLTDSAKLESENAEHCKLDVKDVNPNENRVAEVEANKIDAKKVEPNECISRIEIPKTPDANITESTKSDSQQSVPVPQQAEIKPAQAEPDESILEQDKAKIDLKLAEANKDTSQLLGSKESNAKQVDSTKLEAYSSQPLETNSKQASTNVPGVPSLPPSTEFAKEPEAVKTEDAQHAPPTNEEKILPSNLGTIKTEPLTYAQVAETPKVEDKPKLAEEQKCDSSNASAKQSEGEVLAEAPLSTDNKKENPPSSIPKEAGAEKKENNKAKKIKSETKPQAASGPNAPANPTPNSNQPSQPEAPQAEEIPENQEESVNVQELTEHVMNILNEGGTDQHDLLKKNVELQQFIVKLIHLLKEKTDLCANLDRQNSALTSQSKSLKDVISITKDLLGIRNLEVERLHGDLNLMENAIKEERTRHNTAVQHLTEAMGINDKLKKEYHIQMDLFEKLKEKYTEKVVILTKENMRMKALLEQHNINPAAVPDCMLPLDPSSLESDQPENVDK